MLDPCCSFDGGDPATDTVRIRTILMVRSFQTSALDDANRALLGLTNLAWASSKSSSSDSAVSHSQEQWKIASQ